MHGLEARPSQPGKGGGRPGPFRGLDYYTEADAKWFFGRARERNIIGAHLRTSKLTLLYAESGVGKSSLLRAGVAARLRNLARQRVEGGKRPKFVPVVFSSWKDDPIGDLISEVEAQTRSLIDQVPAGGLHAAGSQSGGGAPQTPLAAAITKAAGALGGRLVIILDQFDELFGYQKRLDRLADELAACINSPEVPANFLIAVRDDAYGRIGELFRGRIGDVYANYLHLDYLTRDTAREAIEGPVGVYNEEHQGRSVVIGEGLVDAVLDEVGRDNLELGSGRREQAGGNSTPTHEDAIEAAFLQLVMERLWECEMDHGSGELRKETLEEELGGAEEIVSRHFDRALDGLSEQQLNAASDIFAQLVTPSGTKIAHTAQDLATMTRHSIGEVTAVLETLDSQRIVRAVDPAPGKHEARYELFHDRLAKPVLEWRNQQETKQLQRDKQVAEREARRFKRLYRIAATMTLVSVLALAVAVGLWLYARHQKQKAVDEETNAVSLALASNAQLQVGNRPDAALSLALAGYRVRQGDAAANGMIGSLEAFRRSGALAVLHGHTDSVNTVAVSPDGRMLASGSSDATIRLWDTRTHRPIGRPLRDPRATGIRGVTFSPDGRTLASAGGSDPTIRLWDVATGRETRAIQADNGAGAYAYWVAFSPDGRTFATATQNSRIELWDARTGAAVGPPFECRCGKVASVAFSPDGRLLASGGYDHMVSLWDVRTHRRLARMAATPGNIYAVTFSSDGRTVASSDTESVIRLWSVARRTQVEPPLRGHSGPIPGLAFSPGYLASAGVDGTVRLWNVRTHREIGDPLTGHSGTVSGVAFGPDGHTLASAGSDGTLRIWDARSLRRLGDALPGRAGKVFGLALSRDGSTFASASTDGRVRMWNARTLLALEPPLAGRVGGVDSVAFSADGNALAAGGHGGHVTLWNLRTRQPRTLGGNGALVRSLSFSPDGHRLAWADERGVLTVTDLQSGRVLGRLSTGKAGMNSVLFSPDGQLLAAGGNGGAVRLWDARRLTPLRPIRGGSATVEAIAFSPDGRTLATGGDDKRIRLWSTFDHMLLGTLRGSTGSVFALAFSPYPGLLASAGTDDMVRLWNLRSRTQLGPALAGHADAVYSVAFTPDGRTLISGSSDRTVRVWSGIFWRDLTDLENQVCALIGTGLSRAEWPQYAPGIRYRPSCPMSP